MGEQLGSWVREHHIRKAVRIVLTSAVRSEAARLLEPWVPAPTSTSTATWVDLTIFGSQKYHRRRSPTAQDAAGQTGPATDGRGARTHQRVGGKGAGVHQDELEAS